jgi:hypothetical protein
MSCLVKDYLKNGFALTKAPLGEKGPKQKNWNKKENAITDPERADEFKGMNVGLLHAYCRPHPLCCLDLDDVQSANKWLRQRGVDLGGILYSGEVSCYSSGRENRLKAPFKLHAALPSVKIHDDEKNVIFEFRCATSNGDSVQDLLPPSKHPNGSTYKWLNGDFKQLDWLPASLVSIWMSELSKSNKSKSKAPQQFIESDSNILKVKDALSKLDADCDRDMWRNIVWGVLSTGWSCAYELALDWSMTGYIKFDRVEFDRVVNSDVGTDRTGKQITIGSVFYYAKGGEL